MAATGAIGSATTAELAAQGAHVIAMARHQDKLEDLIAGLPDNAKVTPQVLDAMSTDAQGIGYARPELKCQRCLEPSLGTVRAGARRDRRRRAR